MKVFKIINLSLLFFICCLNLDACAIAKNKPIDPPISIKFYLKKAGYITLAIEDSSGFRIRNLISDTWFPEGENTVYWDGTDDLGRDADAANHGYYHIPAHLVKPGSYKIIGLERGEITPKYEFSVYTKGNPPWNTPDHTGGWLGNHSPPMASLFVPGDQSPTGQPVILLGCYVTEGNDGLIWVDMDGKKLGGKIWIGGLWTAAPFLARDAGEKRIIGNNTYVASIWQADTKADILQLRITALTQNADKPVLSLTIGTNMPKTSATFKLGQLGGLAVYNGTLVVSLTAKNQLLCIDAKSGKIIDSLSIPSPTGLAFTKTGTLLVLTDKKLVRFNSISPFSSHQIIVSGLSDPFGITQDDLGQFYISDRGKSNQVKVYNQNGDFIRAIGKEGAQKAGPYDSLHMNNPAGISIDSRKHLWVAEENYIPKRVSVWSLDGKLIKAFYGPGKYGGGGTLDPKDSTKFYYSDGKNGSMQFKLNWKNGTSQLSNIYYLPTDSDQQLSLENNSPETPIYFKGKKYFTDCYNSNATNGSKIAFLFIERNGIAFPAAAMGNASAWDILKSNDFKIKWPEGTDPNSKVQNKAAFFIWSDLNGDSKMQPNEVTFIKGYSSGITIMPDLSFCIARYNDEAITLSPESFINNEIPVYNSNKIKVIAQGVLPPASSGGDQVLSSADGLSVISLGLKPASQYSITGTQNGIQTWSYPDLWPGLHASHGAPVANIPGELIGTTRFLGGLINLNYPNKNKLFAINGNMGNVYLFTLNGLFVTTLFDDSRNGNLWKMPNATRGMSLEKTSLGSENFWPTITQTDNGCVYLVDGRRSAIISLQGINTITSLTNFTLSVTQADLKKCVDYLSKKTNLTVESDTSNKTLNILNIQSPVVDGKLNEWQAAQWAEIDNSGVKAFFNSKNKPYDVKAAIATDGTKLYIAYQTGNSSLLTNSGEMPVAPFKTGGCLDLMLGTNSTADPNRKSPVAGDLRLIVTMVHHKPWAVLYRAVVKGTNEKDKISFSSPLSTITFDKVQDVTKQIQLAGNAGNYEVSIPLITLGLIPKDGLSIKGDLGILRGDGNETIARTYWSNKKTAITDDVPSEAMLTPYLWGNFTFYNTK